jgi:glycosyltransferase involved in cell wall biosynthesis
VSHPEHEIPLSDPNGAVVSATRPAGQLTTGGRKVRIASVIKRLHIGGDQVRLLSYAKTVDRERFEHVVVVVHPIDDERDARVGPMLRQFQDAGVDVEVIDREVVSVTGTPAPVSAGLRRRARDVRNAWAVLGRLTAIFRERQIDVVDARLNFGTVFGLLAARRAGVPVVTMTGYYPEHWRRPRPLEPVGQLAMAMVDAFITDADATVEAFDRWRWSKRARLAMIPNGVPPATSPRSKAEMRAELGLPTDPRVRVVGAVCRMIEGKGYPTFIRAARHILDAEPDTAFLFCGYSEDPEFRAGLVELAQSLGLGERAVFTSYPGPVGDAFAALDVYVRASVEDSSPIGVHEAMSVGLPIVLTRVGGAEELVDDGTHALLIPPEDPGALSAAVLRLLRDPALCARMGRAGRERYRARHRPEVMARAHERLWTELLAAKGIRPTWLKDRGP